MQDIGALVVDFLSSDRAVALFESLAKLLIGFLLARAVSGGLGRMISRQVEAHQLMLVKRITFYLIFGLFAASAVMALGFDLSIVLGAAGILTVALGFASQTSASNVISGLFLLGEKPFGIGDIIRVGQTTGEVLSIDLLSVKLRTFDNLFVRIPNETMIKSEIVNLRRFPIRRYDLQVGVAYKEDIPTVQNVLMEVADKNPLCLEEPKPLIIFQGYAESALTFQFSVWAETDNFLALRNSISTEVKQAFDAHNIEIPFPHRTLYTGSVTDPLPITMVNSDADSAPVTEQSPSDGAEGSD